MDRPGVRQVPEGSRKQGKMEKSGCEIIFCAPTTLAVKGLMMMMMMMMMMMLMAQNIWRGRGDCTFLVGEMVIWVDRVKVKV